MKIFNPLKTALMLLTFCSVLSCYSNIPEMSVNEIKPGAYKTDSYIPLLEGKLVAVVANHSSKIGETHLVDSLLALGINIKRIFSPEHGFRGDADAGEHVADYIDEKTGIKVTSLYGKNFKPSDADLSEIDVVVFDIQDVGVRFYTYISTLHYTLEACVKNNISYLVLDRPNPNGFYVDGPLLDPRFKSFVGMHPVPLVHGMTIGEFALMIVGEKWLASSNVPDIEVITCENYHHNSRYELPDKPSPNLSNMLSVYLYPSLGLFEGTIMNVGRGTDFPFQVFGHPDYHAYNFSYIPVSKPGASTDPKHQGEVCYGKDLRDFDPGIVFSEKRIVLEWVIEAFQNRPPGKNFFNSFFPLLAGTDKLEKQIRKGISEDEIRSSWQGDIEKFKVIRSKYLLYEDFE